VKEEKILLIVADDATGTVLTEAVRNAGCHPIVRGQQSSQASAAIWWDADRYSTSEVLPMLDLNRETPVIAVTADSHIGARLLDGGFVDMVMIKPVTSQQVLQALDILTTQPADCVCL
jgi:CheY-like chemotaxis protein